jgi:hypothetical protein
MRVAFAAVLLFVLLAAPAARADSTALVLGRTVGDISIGETEKSVHKAYGKPVSLKHGTYGGGLFDLARYKVTGGLIEVYFDRKTRLVVGIATTSARYRTSAGFGVGSPGLKAKALGFTWNAPCTVSYLKDAAGIHMEIITRGLKRTTPVSVVYFIRLAYAGDC